MNRNRSSFAIVVTIVAVVMVLGGCSQPKTVEVPSPVPVKRLYQELVKEKETNETRSEARVKSRPVLSFEGPVTKIENEKVQFHFDIRDLAKDEYVEC